MAIIYNSFLFRFTNHDAIKISFYGSFLFSSFNFIVEIT